MHSTADKLLIEVKFIAQDIIEIFFNDGSNDSYQYISFEEAGILIKELNRILLHYNSR